MKTGLRQQHVLQCQLSNPFFVSFSHPPLLHTASYLCGCPAVYIVLPGVKQMSGLWYDVCHIVCIVYVLLFTIHSWFYIVNRQP